MASAALAPTLAPTRPSFLRSNCFRYRPRASEPTQPAAEVCLLTCWRLDMPAKKKGSSRKYGKAAGKTVASAMRRMKKGTLKSGKGGKGGTVKSRAAFADDGGDRGHLEEHHFAQVHRDGLGNVPLLRANARISPRRVNQHDNRQAELVRQPHEPQ